MAWTHYTAPLAAGEELTGGMRDELLAAVAERLAVIGWSFDPTWSADVIGSSFACGQSAVRWTNGVGTFQTTLSELLIQDNLASRYHDAEGPSLWSASTLRAAAAAAEGLTLVEWSVIAPAAEVTGWHLRPYWNFIRRLVTLLDCPCLPMTGGTGGHYDKSSGIPEVVGWSARKVAFLAGGESFESAAWSPTAIQIDSAVSDEDDDEGIIFGRRWAGTVPIPGGLPAPYDAWVWARFTSILGGTLIVPEMQADWDGAALVTTIPGAGTTPMQVPLASAATASGTVPLDLRLTAFDDSTALDFYLTATEDYRPSTVMSVATGLLGRISFRPTWVYPA